MRAEMWLFTDKVTHTGRGRVWCNRRDKGSVLRSNHRSSEIGLATVAVNPNLDVQTIAKRENRESICAIPKQWP